MIIRFIGVYVSLLLISGILMTQAQSTENTLRVCMSRGLSAVTVKSDHYCVNGKTHTASKL